MPENKICGLVNNNNNKMENTMAVEEKTAYEVSLKYPIGLSDGTCGEYEWETIIVVADSISKIIEHFDETLIENISVRGKGITLN